MTRWPVPQSWFSRLPKLVMSSRICAGMPLPGEVGEEILGQAQVHALDDRQEHGASLGVLPAVLVEVGVLLDVVLERRRLFGGRVDRGRRR